MATGSWLLAFTAGVAVSLAASWLLVSRLERLGDQARSTSATDLAGLARPAGCSDRSR